MKEDKLIPFDMERCKNGEKVITRKGKDYKFGSYNPDTQDYVQVVGWVGDNVVISNIKGECHPITDSNYDLFMAPKMVKTYTNVNIPSADILMEDIEECKSNKQHYHLGIICFTTIGDTTTCEIVHHYKQDK